MPFKVQEKPYYFTAPTPLPLPADAPVVLEMAPKKIVEASPLIAAPALVHVAEKPTRLVNHKLGKQVQPKAEPIKIPNLVDSSEGTKAKEDDKRAAMLKTAQDMADSLKKLNESLKSNTQI